MVFGRFEMGGSSFDLFFLLDRRRDLLMYGVNLVALLHSQHRTYFLELL